jgi:uncharacterized membrane protein
MSDRSLRNAGLGLTAAGIAVAAYLSWAYLFEAETACVAGGGSCERVQTSDYAELAGIPVAVIGLAGYAAIGAALLVPGETARTAGAAMGLAGFGFSAYLTYLELFEIEAICQWCVASAVLMTALAAVTCARALRGP